MAKRYQYSFAASAKSRKNCEYAGIDTPMSFSIPPIIGRMTNVAMPKPARSARSMIMIGQTSELTLLRRSISCSRFCSMLS